LPVEQNESQVAIAALPSQRINIIVTCNAHQIVKVDFIDGLILVFCEIEFVSHFVGQEQSLVTGLLVTHSVACSCECQQTHQGYHHLLLHTFISYILIVITFWFSPALLQGFYLVLDAKENIFPMFRKGFSLNHRGKSLNAR